MGTRNLIGSSVRIIPLLKHRAISLTPIVAIILPRCMLYVLLYILSDFTDLFRVVSGPVVTISPSLRTSSGPGTMNASAGWM